MLPRMSNQHSRGASVTSPTSMDTRIKRANQANSWQKWLDDIEALREVDGLRHVRLDSPLKVVLDSRDSEAIVVR